MPISFSLRDILSTAERTALKAAFGVATDAELETTMTNVSKAVLREFSDAVLGLYPARSGPEINERRLLHLIQYHFGMRIPTELQLTQLLRITETNATTLLRNLSARQQAALQPSYVNTLQIMFDAKVPNVDNVAHHVTIVSKHIVEWLRMRSSVVAPTFGAISKVKGTNDRYAIPLDTYNAICASLGLRA
ncbi:MAG TPA: hypothetical protein VGF98_10920 [Candidatus Tumulicola sp.]|jgi:hypothetical protein